MANWEKMRRPEDIIRIIMKEIFLVMQAHGSRRFHIRDATTTIIILWRRQLPPTAGHRASMLQDIQEGRKTEIDALNGAISQYARDLGSLRPTMIFSPL